MNALLTMRQVKTDRYGNNAVLSSPWINKWYSDSPMILREQKVKIFIPETV